MACCSQTTDLGGFITLIVISNQRKVKKTIGFHRDMAREVRAWLPGLLFLCLAAPVHSASYPYGMTINRAGDHSSDRSYVDGGASPLPEEPPSSEVVSEGGEPNSGLDTGTPAPSDGELRQQRLRTAQERVGPYSSELSEPLIDLARYYRASGRWDEALVLYRRALHIVRINNGLYSAQQIPLVRAELDLYRGAADWETLDERYDYYFRLFGSGEPPLDELRLSAVVAYLAWQREALRLGLEADPGWRLLDLIDLNERLLEIVMAAEPQSSPAYQALALSQVKNLYLLQNLIEPVSERAPLNTTLPGQIQSDQQINDIYVRRLQSLRRGGYARGKSLLEELSRNQADSASPVDRARAELALADWMQWHGNTRQASEVYEKVVSELSRAGEGDTLQHWFAEPVELPDNGVFLPADASGERSRIARMRFTVTDSGRVQNVVTVTQDADLSASQAKLRRELRKVRFRPAWIGGSLQGQGSIERDYYLVR